jgi:hypothetical protein
MRSAFGIGAMSAVVVLAFVIGPSGADKTPAWKSLPELKPTGEKTDIGGYVSDPHNTDWKAPKFVYDADVATKPKLAKVIVIIYNPVLESEGGVKLIDHFKWNDPREYSHILANTIEQASGGYIHYDIVEFLELDEYPVKIDGYQLTDELYLELRKDPSKSHQPDRSNYRTIFEKNGLIERIRKEGITEVWIWGAGWFGFDELAMYIPNRYARFAPTDNPWFYRPYEIPPECGRTVWVMGFNYECGPDNMIHSYAHRVESIIALQVGHEMDNPGRPSHVGNCHVPPNGQGGYDYNNSRSVLSYADNWFDYPDLTKRKPRSIGSVEWGNNQFGYMEWWLSHIPRREGYTEWGYNNWWVYIANTDEDLPDYTPTDPSKFKAPKD